MLADRAVDIGGEPQRRGHLAILLGAVDRTQRRRDLQPARAQRADHDLLDARGAFTREPEHRDLAADGGAVGFRLRSGAGARGGGRGAGAGGGGAGTFAGTSTLPCLAFVQLASDGLDGAAAPESGTTQTATNEQQRRPKQDLDDKPMIARPPPYPLPASRGEGNGCGGVDGRRQPCDRKSWPARPVPDANSASKSARSARRSGAPERLAGEMPGGSPEQPIDVAAASIVEGKARATPCIQCGGDLELRGDRATSTARGVLRELALACRRCHAPRTLVVPDRAARRELIGGPSP